MDNDCECCRSLDEINKERRIYLNNLKSRLEEMDKKLEKKHSQHTNRTLIFLVLLLFTIIALSSCSPRHETYTLGYVVTREYEVSSKPPVPIVELKPKETPIEEFIDNNGWVE